MYEQMIKLVKLLDACNIQAGLEYLNSRVPHRFTAIYKLDGDVFILQHFVDKRGEIAPQLLTVVPLRTASASTRLDWASLSAKTPSMISA